jgi:hypothetical protein
MATYNLEEIDNEYDLNQFVIQQIKRCIDLNDQSINLQVLIPAKAYQSSRDWEFGLFCAQMIKNTVDDKEKELKNA